MTEQMPWQHTLSERLEMAAQHQSGLHDSLAPLLREAKAAIDALHGECSREIEEISDELHTLGAGTPDAAAHKVLGEAADLIRKLNAQPHAARAAAPVERAWTEAELDALPDDSLVGVNIRPDGEHFGAARYAVFQKWGRDSWIHLDPADRNDGEDLMPSGYLIHLGSRYGQLDETRIRAFYLPQRGQQ